MNRSRNNQVPQLENNLPSSLMHSFLEIISIPGFFFCVCLMVSFFLWLLGLFIFELEQVRSTRNIKDKIQGTLCSVKILSQ